MTETYAPRREIVEHAYYRASRGRRMPGSRWDPLWLCSTDFFEGQKTASGYVSTCAVFVNSVLRDCGCAERWILKKWTPGSSIIRWRSCLWGGQGIDSLNPTVDTLKPGDILIWRARSPLAHTGFYLGRYKPDLWLTAEGGQPGGKVKKRGVSIGKPDLALSLDVLKWKQGFAPTVGHWLESKGLPSGECRAEDFLLPEELDVADAPPTMRNP